MARKIKVRWNRRRKTFGKDVLPNCFHGLCRVLLMVHNIIDVQLHLVKYRNKGNVLRVKNGKSPNEIEKGKIGFFSRVEN